MNWIKLDYKEARYYKGELKSYVYKYSCNQCGYTIKRGELPKHLCSKCKISPKNNKKEYKSYKGMFKRCYGNDKKYHTYKTKGIIVCDRWKGKGGFNRFVEDLGLRPEGKYSIDRIDNNGNYEPSNCQWLLHSLNSGKK